MVTTTVKFRSRLSNLEVDRAFRGRARLFRKRGWSDQIASSRLVIDLSALEFADFAAAGRLLLLIEGVARHGARIELVPPAANLRAGERAFMEGKASTMTDAAMLREQRRIARSVGARRQVTTFLQHTGFAAAAELAVLQLAEPPRWVEDQSAWTASLAMAGVAETGAYASLGENARGSTPDDLPAIRRFTWLHRCDAPSRAAWEERMIGFLSRTAVLTQQDAAAIVTTVLDELIENVHEHAGQEETGEAIERPLALVGALTLRRGAFASADTRDIYRSENDFNMWLRGRDARFVTLFVGDAGVGIPRTLSRDFVARGGPNRGTSGSGQPRPHDVILYSFQPIASRYGEEDRRGLGLAGVLRHVRGYQGRVAIRSGNATAGYWCPASKAMPVGEDGLAYVPGTSVTVNLGATLAAQRQGGMTKGRSRDTSELVLVRWDFDNHSIRDVAMGALRTSNAASPIVAIWISSWPESRNNQITLAVEIRKAAVGLEGVGGLAVMLPGASRTEIGGIFAPLDEVGERTPRLRYAWELEEWTPPVLIVSSDGQGTWTGGTEALRRLLYEVAEGGRLTIEEAKSRFAEGTGEHDLLSLERDWVATENGMLCLRATTAAIGDVVADQVAALILERLASR